MPRSTIDIRPCGLFIVATEESGKTVFITRRPANADFSIRDFAAEILLQTMNDPGISNVIRDDHTITFTSKEGLIYCLCTTLAEQPKRLERQQLCLEETSRLCQMLLGPKHSIISAQMDGIAQGLAKRTFWNIKRFIDLYLDDRLFCVAPNLRWVGAIPEEATNTRPGRFRVKCSTLGAFLVLRLREPEPPMCVYQSKQWKLYSTLDRKLFVALGDILGRQYSTTKNSFEALRLYVGKTNGYLTIMSIPKEYGCSGLVLVRITGGQVDSPTEQMLKRIAKYSQRAPTFMEKLRLRAS